VPAARGSGSSSPSTCLPERVDLEPGQALRWPFTLRVPLASQAPSISTSEFTLRWLPRAVLDSPPRPDPTVAVELWGTTRTLTHSASGGWPRARG
jgi:hypothetical protein